MDTSLRPVRPREWAAVLDAVYHAHDGDEKTWLEWKSTLDLRSKEQMATIVSKAIIALANRDPDESAATVGGIGILLIGIEPGSVPGVTPVDNADLDQLISLYVGGDGPLWQPHWDQYQGQNILIIEVSPPQWGDRPHAFRKTFGAITDGQVYVRKLARSVPADHNDIQRLADRYAAKPQESGLDVAIVVDYPCPIPRFTWTENDLESYVSGELYRLMEPLRKERSRRAAAREAAPATGLAGLITLPSMGVAMFGQNACEPRSEAAYEAEIVGYLAIVRKAWPSAMRAVAAQVFPAPVFKIKNLSDRNYLRAQVMLTVPADAGVARTRRGNADLRLSKLLPSGPRIWGSYTTTGLFGGNWIQDVPSITRTPIATVAESTTLEREPDGSLTLTFAAVDVRPERIEVLDRRWAVVIPSSWTDPVIATWTATATNANGIARGEFPIEFTGPDVNIFEAMNK